jgi:hypothetical protein
MCISEIRRVLKPRARYLAIDFGGSAEQRNSIVGRLHARVNFELRRDNSAREPHWSLSHVQSGPMGFHDMEFIRAAAPAA